MLWDLFLLAAFALGHFCILIYLINTSHGLPVSERAITPIMLGIILAWLVLTGLVIIAMPGLSWSSWPLGVALYAFACWVVGLVRFPAAMVLLHFREMPAGVRETDSERVDLAEEEGVANLAGHGHGSWMLRLPGCESLQLRTREWAVELAGLPPALDGLSILHLTDFHFTRAYNRRFFETVAERCSADEADLVVFTGDLIDDAACLDWIEPAFRRLKGRLGAFAILGNHDYLFDVRSIREALGRAEFVDLEGRWEALEIDGASLALGGTAAPWGPYPDLRQHRDADVRVLLSHSPDQFFRASRAGIDLVLAGHNHGGQIRLPVVGPVLMPSAYGRRFDRGFFEREATLMFVGQGLSGKHPVRYGCTPEINRLVLRAPVRHREAHVLAAGQPTVV